MTFPLDALPTRHDLFSLPVSGSSGTRMANLGSLGLCLMGMGGGGVPTMELNHNIVLSKDDSSLCQEPFAGRTCCTFVNCGRWNLMVTEICP